MVYKLFGKIRNKLDANKGVIIRFCIYLAIMLAVYAPFFVKQYVTHDHAHTYPVYELIDWNIASYASGGRFTVWFFKFILVFLFKLGLSKYEASAVYLQLIGTVVYAVSACVLRAMFKTDVDDLGEHFNVRNISVDFAVLVCFVNPFIVETYTYSAIDWSFQLLLSVLGAYLLLHHRWIWGVVFAILAMGMYQSDILIILIICFAVVFLEYIDDKKSLLKYTFLYGLICTFIAFGMMIIQRLIVSWQNVNTTKEIVNGGDDVVTSMVNIVVTNEKGMSIFQIIRYTLEYVDGLLPHYFLFVLIGTVVLIVTLYTINDKNTIWNIVIFLCMSLLIIFIPFIVGIVVNDPNFEPRVILGLFFSVGLLLVIACDYSSTVGILGIIGRYITVLFSFIIFFYTIITVSDCYLKQAIDEREVISIYHEIERYENETGYVVDNIICGYDADPLRFYPELTLHHRHYSFCERIVHSNWSDIQYLNMVNGKQYSGRHFLDGEYADIFGDKQWDYYCPEEQLVFDQNTMYWAIY